MLHGNVQDSDIGRERGGKVVRCGSAFGSIPYVMYKTQGEWVDS